MHKITIELPATFGFVRAKQNFTVATENLRPEIIAQLVMHGAEQKIGDAAAGKDGAEAMTAMNAVYAALSNGDWGRTRGASAGGVDRFVREAMLAMLPAEIVAKLRAMKAEDRNEKLEAAYGKFADDDARKAKIDEKAEALREIDRKAKAAKAKMAEAGGIDLDFD